MLNLYVVLLNIIYSLFKILPTNKKKIFFLSRQSNNISLDFDMLIKKIQEDYPDYKIALCVKMIGNGIIEKIKYIFLMFVQMYHLSTSSVCVIDGYNVAVSVLKHKKNLKVIQLWHALGAIKKFGYQTLDKESGNSSKTAHIMKMHNNYDLIISGSIAMIPYFSEAFNQPKEKFINCGLPRIDYLIKKSKNNKKKILKKYPELKKKKIILYVPTFRKNKDYYVNKLIKSVDKEKYELIIKGHPLKNLNLSEVSKEFNSLELLSIADYIITDYSAISIEASVLNKPIYFYVYDIDEYKKTVGLNIDIKKEYPNLSFKKAKDLIKNIEENTYDYEELKNFKKKYLDNTKGNATEIIVKHIVGEL